MNLFVAKAGLFGAACAHVHMLLGEEEGSSAVELREPIPGT